MKMAKLALVAGLITSAISQAGEFIPAPNQATAIEGAYIIKFKDSSMPQTLNTLSVSAAVNDKISALTSRFLALPKKRFIRALRGAVFEMDEVTAKKIANEPDVAWVEQDQVMTVNVTQINPTWGIDRLDQRTGSLDSSYTYNTTASNVNVYVIDTGVNNHSDFGSRVSNGWDFVDNDADSSDCHGHGTHVAGTVASATYGVAKGAKVYGVRVLDCQGSGSYSGIISGMDWVAQNHTKPAVVNMSLGGGVSSSIDDAISNLVNAGVVTVVAAGNDNSDACNYSPARAPSAITVGSTALGDSRSSFSNYGSCLDIFAPGSNITSTSQNGGSETMSGTSMASPHVAGVAALYLADNPYATPSQVGQTIVSNATANIVSGANGSPNLLAYTYFGSTPPPPPPVNELENGVPVNNLSATQRNDVTYTIHVPSGATNIIFKIRGGSGDADLYVKFGSAPTDSSYDCRPYQYGNNETCTGSQSGGKYYVKVKAYSSFSGVTLVGSYEDYSNDPDRTPIDFSQSNITVNNGQWANFYYDIPTGYSSMTVSISGGSGDADLYVRHGAQSTLSQYDCRPYISGNNESCTFSNPASGRWYLDLHGYSTASGITLRLQAN